MSTDPTVAELLRTLRGLEASFGTVREELARQDERTKSAVRAVEDIARRFEALSTSLAQRLTAFHAEELHALQQEIQTLRADVDRLLAVIKPDARPGLLQEQRALKDRVLRITYGVGGVLFVLTVAGVLLGLATGWVKLGG